MTDPYNALALPDFQLRGRIEHDFRARVRSHEGRTDLSVSERTSARLKFELDTDGDGDADIRLGARIDARFRATFSRSERGDVVESTVRLAESIRARLRIDADADVDPALRGALEELGAEFVDTVTTAGSDFGNDGASAGSLFDRILDAFSGLLEGVGELFEPHSDTALPPPEGEDPGVPIEPPPPAPELPAPAPPAEVGGPEPAGPDAARDFAHQLRFELQTTFAARLEILLEHVATLADARAEEHRAEEADDDRDEHEHHDKHDANDGRTRLDVRVNASARVRIHLVDTRA